MKNLIKRIIYSTASKSSLKKFHLQLGYNFHVENIFDDKLFAALTVFCRDYFSLTKTMPICCIIPPTSVHVGHTVKSARCPEEKFSDRVKGLSEIATIGYHGHFYQTEDFAYENAMHSFSFNAEVLKKQFMRDLEWFAKNGIEHNGIYTGGWWFMNKTLAELLSENGFVVDFSFSKAKYFYNAFSNNIMIENSIRAGEPFELVCENRTSVLCIQNFIGAHTSPFVLDFDRNVKKFSLSSSGNVGVINSHDYDLHPRFTLKCIEHLMMDAGATFYSFEELKRIATEKSERKIMLSSNHY